MVSRGRGRARGTTTCSNPRVVLLPIEHLTDAGLAPAFARLLTTRAGWRLAARWRSSTRMGSLLRAQRRARHGGRGRAAAAAPPRRGRDAAPSGYGLRAAPSTRAHGSSTSADVDPAISGPGAPGVHSGPRRSHGAERLRRHGACYSRRPGGSSAPTTSATPSPPPRRARRGPMPPPTSPSPMRSTGSAPASRRVRPPVATVPVRSIPRRASSSPSRSRPSRRGLPRRWKQIAEGVVATYHATWRGAIPRSFANLCEWLATDAPPLVVTPTRAASCDPRGARTARLAARHPQGPPTRPRSSACTATWSGCGDHRRFLAASSIRRRFRRRIRARTDGLHVPATSRTG